jgi:2-polyprenyl-6-methoxyphenol hydroxylase-like FAD-dependent oxidoreductase
MSWALPLLEKLLPATLFNTINFCQPDPTANAIEVGKHGITIRDGSTGEVRKRMPFPSIRRVNHKKTKKHLSQGLSVQYGKRLVEISVNSNNNEEVTAHFQDGTTETGTIIVGADGGASRVRRWLLGDAGSQEVLPCKFMNFSFSLPSELALRLGKDLSPTVEVGCHPKNMYMGLSLLDKPESTKPETWLFYLLASWQISSGADSPNSGNQLAELRSRMDGWVDPFKIVVEKLLVDTVIKDDQLRIWRTKPWNNHQGRVTLVGDAAHR